MFLTPIVYADCMKERSSFSPLEKESDHELQVHKQKLIVALSRFIQFHQIEQDKYDVQAVRSAIRLQTDLSPSKARQHRLLAEYDQLWMELIKTELKQKSFYLPLLILRKADRVDLIRQVIDHELAAGQIESVDLMDALLEYGDPQMVDARFQEYINREPWAIRHFFEEKRYVKARMQPIQSAYADFAKKHHLPADLVTIGGYASPSEYVNAAVELKERQYDLAIGVLNSGVPLASMLDFLGQETRYLEWHRGWKRGPKWKKMGRNTEKITQAKRILVCEHDMDTGQTLEAIVPFLRKLKPETVDIVFRLDMRGGIPQKVAACNFFREIALIEDFPKHHYVHNLNAVAAEATRQLQAASETSREKE